VEEAREHPALAELWAGHHRFLSRRPALPKVHAPRVAMLACADARVDPNRIFDAEAGELFVVRTAGNVVSKEVLEALAFARKLGVSGIVVLGHTDCGAVWDALSESPTLPATASQIRANLAGEKDPAEAARAHARATARRIETELGPGIPVLAALFRIENGEVEWL